MHNKKRIMTAALAALLLAGCGPGANDLGTAHTPSAGCEIRDYRNGVFYFHCTDRFGEALSEFRKAHKVTSVAAHDGGGGTYGYWVVCE